jgi:hypothetical protein
VIVRLATAPAGDRHGHPVAAVDLVSRRRRLLRQAASGRRRWSTQCRVAVAACSGRGRNTVDRKSATRSSDFVESDGAGRGKGGKGGKGGTMMTRMPNGRPTNVPRPVIRPEEAYSKLGSSLTVR